MSEPREPGDLPPDLPPEYAEAYRRGYERAFLEASGQPAEPEPAAPVDEPEPRVVEPEPRVVEPVETTDEPDPAPAYDDSPTVLSGPLFADEVWDDGESEPTQVVPVGAVPPAPTPEPPAEPRHAAEPGFDTGPIWRGTPEPEPEPYLDEEDDGPRERPGWFVPALLGGLVLALVLGAYGIGRVLSSSVGDADVSAEKPDGVLIGDGAQGDGKDKGNDGNGGGQEDPEAYQGAVEVTPIGGASGSCQAPSSVDAAGNRVGYPPTSAYDGDLTTAWRCNGRGVGQTLSLTFAEPVEVGELALVPGYAKTDPRSGVDRYAENNRITRVRWTFPDGSTVVQDLDGAPSNRSLQARRIKPVQADSVTLEVLASAPGPRNTIAISEVQIGRTAG